MRKEPKAYYVYIMASGRNGTLYVGVTNDLVRRVSEHKRDIFPGFTKKYHCHSLVHFEQTGDANSAITREKQLKWWRRKWKLQLIEESNPDWRDLWDEII
jgi:putative endonuclease